MLLDADGTRLSTDSLGAAIAHVDRAIRGLQQLITELRPQALDELGIGPALDSLARTSAERSGVEVRIEGDLSGGSLERLPTDVEATIYRVVQEAVANALVHGQPEHVTISVTRGDGAVRIVVADDGRGFDPDTADRGFGLIGMQERVSLAGGGFEVESAPGNGAEVRATVPLG